MATLIELEKSKNIVQIDVELEFGVQQWRCLYGSPDFIEWLTKTLPNLNSPIPPCDMTPLEQVDAIFNNFCSGSNLNSDRRFKKLSRNPDEFIWELKTIDIRIFGWFPARDHFVCTYGDLKEEIVKYDSYGKYMAQSIYFRNNLDLDEPKFIGSKEYLDVFSDANR